MPANSFGTLFTVTTWGESHGPAIGCVIDGCPAGINLDESALQPYLDRRRPGHNPHGTARTEADRVRILSGTHRGLTTGQPLSLQIENTNQRSSDYDEVAQFFRPGHADIAYQLKYGIRDPRGGGRSSARETACRVAAGAVALQVLANYPETAGIRLRAGLVRLGDIECDPAAWDKNPPAENDLFCPDSEAAVKMAGAIAQARADGDSLGGIVEVRADNVPHGLGEPLYDRFDARLAGYLMGINAAKGVEIGDGFAAAGMRGSVHNDAMRGNAGGKTGDLFQTNHAGGILGGITTGAPIRARVAFKPTPSIAKTQATVDAHYDNADISVAGRHDPAVCVRATPVVEAMTALCLVDFFLLHRARG